MMQGLANSCYFSGDGLACMLGQIVSAFGGEALFGLLMGAVIFGVFYVAADGDMATPTVALILTGTVLVGTLPSNYQRMAFSVVAIGLTAAVWQVIKQYVLDGSVVR